MTLTRTKLGILLLALAVNAVLVGGPSAREAYACSCAGIQTPAEGLRTSDAVFSGEVVDLGLDDIDPRDDVPLGGVKFNVKKSWKGVSERSVVIYGQGESYGTSVINTCDVEFQRGEAYLVYAYRGGEGKNGPFGTSICTATKPLAEAGADLKVLGPAAAQLPGTGGTGVSTPEHGLRVGVTLIFLFLFCGLLVALRLRGD